MPDISVIIPVYKVEPYLHRCVDSVIAQTYKDFEAVLIDDGSPDGCGAICDEYALNDDRVLAIHQLNGGLSAARNIGIDWAFACSNSEWLGFVDSDDWVHEDYTAVLMDALNKTGASVAVVAFERTAGEKTFVIEGKLETKLVDVQDFFCHYYITSTTAWGKLFKLADWQNLRFPQGMVHEDEYMTWKILFQYQSVAFVNAPLYAYFSNPEGIMAAAWSPQRLDVIPAYEEKIKFFSKDKHYKNALRFTEERYFSTLLKSLDRLSKEKSSYKIRHVRNKIQRKTLLYLLKNRTMSFKEKVGYLEQVSLLMYKILVRFI